MYSGETIHTRERGMNLLGESELELSSRFAFANLLSEAPDRFTVGELVTMLPAGTKFPIPLRLHIQVGCEAPESRYSQCLQASVAEMLARVSEAIQASMDDKSPAESGELQGNSFKVIQFGEVEVDFQKMELHRAGLRVALTAHEFKTLRYFLSRPETVISREELLNQVWGYHHYPTTRTVDNRIMRLRQKLEPNPSEPTHFLTVHGVGYKFVP